MFTVSTIYILCAADASKSSSPTMEPLVWWVRMTEAPAPLKWFAGFWPMMPECDTEPPITLPDMWAGSTRGFSSCDSTKLSFPFEVDITFTVKPTVLTSHKAATPSVVTKSYKNNNDN